MKKLYKTLNLLWILFLFLVILSHNQKSYSQVVNSGFETGNTSGWSGSSFAGVSTGMTVLSWTVNPAGTTMGIIEPTLNLLKPAAELNLGLSAGSLVAFNPGLFNTATNFGTLTQDITLNAGQSFIMYWNYISRDYTPYNDGVIATLVGPSYQSIQLLAVTSNAHGNTQAIQTGSYGSTGWHSVTFTAGVAGTYKLGYACFNTGDQAVLPIMLIDNAPGGTSAPGMPIVVTSAVTSTGANTAVSGGNVTSDGGSAVTARGVCWGTTSLPTTSNSFTIDGTGTGVFSSNISGLSPGDTYYIRAYATNIVGTAYGPEITYINGVAPVVNCPSDISVNTSTGLCGANVTFPFASASGTPAPVITYSHASGSFFPIGSTVVTATATNSIGSDSCSFNVTVVDNTPPVAIVQNTTVQLDASGNASIIATDVDNGSNDACGIASLSVAPDLFTCAEVGANTVTLTVTDVNGNISSMDAIVTVEDDISPTITCVGDTIVNSDVGACGAIVNYGIGDILYSTSGGSNLIKINPVTGVTTTIGTFGYGQTYALAFTPDGTAWTIINGFGSAQLASVNLLTGLATPVGTPFGFTAICLESNSSGQLFTIGYNNTNLYTINSVNGVATLIASTGFVSTMDLAFDGSDKLWAINSDGSLYSVNTSSGLLTLESVITGGVNNEMGMAIGTDGAFYLTEYISIPRLFSLNPNSGVATYISNLATSYPHGGDFSLSSVGVSDNCSIVTISQTAGLPSGTLFPTGTTTNTFVATDAAGNTATCSFDVTVNDTEAPAVLTHDITIQLDASGAVSIVAADVDNGSNDACGIASLSVVPSSFTCAEVGTNTVTLTVTDNNGNVSTATAIVTVQDNIAPIALTQDITVQLDNLGSASITANDVNNGSNDACGIDSMIVVPNLFTCAEVGTNTVALTVTDNNGNVSTASALVTIQDNVAPIALAQDITIQLDNLGSASITAADIDNGSNDACGIASLSVAPSSFTCTEVGTNTVTLTVTDVNGNISSLDAIVTVEDNVAPLVVTQNVIIQLDASGNGSVLASAIDNGSSDACGIVSLSVSPGQFDCSTIGSNTVTLLATDANGNSASAIATVTVEDNIPPVLVNVPTNPVEFTINNVNSCNLDVDFYSLGISAVDNCSPNPVITFNPTSGTFDVGTHTITVTSTDDLGNASTSQFDLVINKDKPSLVITEGPGSTSEDEVEIEGYYSDQVTYIEVNWGDGSPNQTVEMDENEFETEHEYSANGSYTIILSYTDICGRVFTEEITVNIVEDDDEGEEDEDEEGNGFSKQNSSMKLYPVPFKKSMYIEYKTSTSERVQATLYDLSGLKVSDLFVRDVRSGRVYHWKYTPDSKLKSGMYLMKIQGDETNLVKRLIYRK